MKNARSGVQKGKAKPRQPLAGAPTLAYSIVCAGCGRTYISVLEAFPADYRCSTCLGPEGVARREYHRVWMKEHKRCARGHLLTEATVYVRPEGKHECRICKRENQVIWRALDAWKRSVGG
jgi:hypothetical protein